VVLRLDYENGGTRMAYRSLQPVSQYRIPTLRRRRERKKRPDPQPFLCCQDGLNAAKRDARHGNALRVRPLLFLEPGDGQFHVFVVELLQADHLALRGAPAESVGGVGLPLQVHDVLTGRSAMPVPLKREEREPLLLVEGPEIRRPAGRGILFAAVVENHDWIRPWPIRCPEASVELIVPRLNRDFLRLVGGAQRTREEEERED